MSNPPAAALARSPTRWVTAAVVVSLTTLAVAFLLGGGLAGSVPGLGDPGGGTRWGLPVAKVVLDGAIALVIGLLGLATALPARKGELGADALRALRAASWAALVLAAAAVVVHLLTLSDLVGVPLDFVLDGPAFLSYTSNVVQGQAYATVTVLALAIVPAARLTLGHGGAIALLCLGVGILIPLSLIGHASSGDYHHSATVSLFVHLVAMSVWVGGLAALAWYAGRRGRWLLAVVRTYSPVALACFVMMAASGVLNAWLRLESPSDLVATTYGVIVVAKAAGLGALGWIGWQHRQRTIPRLADGRPGAFRKLAVGEIMLMAAVIGLSVALSRTPPPLPDVPETVSPVRRLLGYPIPPEPSATRFVTQVYPEGLFFLGCLAAVLLYLAGVRRLRRRGDRWPLGRTIAWLAGVGTVALVQMSGLMTYSMTMLSVHMVQHMTLMMISPVLLVLGAPVTLALRAIRPARHGDTGPREFIVAAVNSPVVRFFTHPVVALALFVSGAYTVYFTGLFEVAMRSHAGHMLMSAHFLLVGYLFYEMLLGVDPLPKRPPFPARVLVQFISMAFHAFFGVAVSGSARLIAGDYYRTLATEIPWLPDPLDDQHLAGLITWGFGEIPGLLIIAVLFVQWYRSDERAARRFDRREAAAEAERTAYNEYLARLDARSRGQDR